MSVKPPKVVTGKKADPKPVDEAEERQEHLLRSLKVAGGDTRPLLLFFHWDHEHEELGKPQTKQCRVMDDEKVARWAGLFHCAEIDVEDSDAKLLKDLGLGEKPSFAIVTNELKLVTTATELNTSRKVVGFMKDALAAEPLQAYWKTVEEELQHQQDSLKKARKLLKKKELLDAHDLFESVRFSEVRIGKFWEDAVTDYEDVAKKIKQER